MLALRKMEMSFLSDYDKKMKKILDDNTSMVPMAFDGVCYFEKVICKGIKYQRRAKKLQRQLLATLHAEARKSDDPERLLRSAAFTISDVAMREGEYILPGQIQELYTALKGFISVRYERLPFFIRRYYP